MKIEITMAFAIGLLLTSCGRPEGVVAIGPELEEDLLEIQREFGLSDEELAEGLRQSLMTAKALQGVVGQDGFTEADIKSLVLRMGETADEWERMTMFSQVVVLEYLQKGDVEGAQEHLRSNIGYRYSAELRKGTSSDDLIMARVKKLGEEDADLKRLMNEKSQGEQGGGGKRE